MSFDAVRCDDRDFALTLPGCVVHHEVSLILHPAANFDGRLEQVTASAGGRVQRQITRLAAGKIHVRATLVGISPSQAEAVIKSLRREPEMVLATVEHLMIRRQSSKPT